MLGEPARRAYNHDEMLRLVIAILFLVQTALPLSACLCASQRASDDLCCAEPQPPASCRGCCMGSHRPDDLLRSVMEDDESRCRCAIHAAPRKLVAVLPDTKGPFARELTTLPPASLDALVQQPEPRQPQIPIVKDRSPTHGQRQATLSVWLC